jgi:hypothetical protein
MAYIVPNESDLKTRYPAFAAVASETIDYWLLDAQGTVTTSWFETDFEPAILSLAAHNMARQGLGATGAGAAGGLTGVTSFRSGSFSASFSDEAVKQSVKGGYGSTIYGQEFAGYLRRNRGGPRVTGAVLGCRW